MKTATYGSSPLARVPLLGLLVAVAGCASAEQQTSPCGSGGTLVEESPGRSCAYIVIEGGFRCPATLAHFVTVGRGGVCSDRPIEALSRKVCGLFVDACDGPCELCELRRVPSDDAGPNDDGSSSDDADSAGRQAEAPLRLLFIVDTSTNMEVVDSPRAAPDNALGETIAVDPAQATRRSRAVKATLERVFDLSVDYGAATACSPAATGCTRRLTECSACTVSAPAVCLATDCCDCEASGSSFLSCGGVRCCGSSEAGLCLPLCASDAPCRDALGEDARCMSGVCARASRSNTRVAAIRMHTAADLVTRGGGGRPGLTDDPGEIFTALPLLNAASGVTNYQGALVAALAALSRDAAALVREQGADAARRARYVVLFVSDGRPDPQIFQPADWDSISPDVRALMVGREQPSEPGLYNTPETILELVGEIAAIETQYGLGEVALHAIDADTGGGSIPAAARRALLQQMAQVGQGTFHTIGDDPTLSWLDL